MTRKQKANKAIAQDLKAESVGPIQITREGFTAYSGVKPSLKEALDALSSVSFSACESLLSNTNEKSDIFYSAYAAEVEYNSVKDSWWTPYTEVGANLVKGESGGNVKYGLYQSGKDYEVFVGFHREGSILKNCEGAGWSNTPALNWDKVEPFNDHILLARTLWSIMGHHRDSAPYGVKPEVKEIYEKIAQKEARLDEAHESSLESFLNKYPIRTLAQLKRVNRLASKRGIFREVLLRAESSYTSVGSIHITKLGGNEYLTREQHLHSNDSKVYIPRALGGGFMAVKVTGNTHSRINGEDITFVWYANEGFKAHVEAKSVKEGIEKLRSRKAVKGLKMSLKDIKEDTHFCWPGTKEFLRDRMPFLYNLTKNYSSWEELKEAEVFTTEFELASREIFDGYQQP